LLLARNILGLPGTGKGSPILTKLLLKISLSEREEEVAQNHKQKKEKTISEERSKKFAPRRATLQLPNTLHIVNLKICTEPNQSEPATRGIIQGKDPQKPSSSSSPMKCWTCNQTGHRKINCPQATCFFCGRSGHWKTTCLFYRLAKMYDEEKNLYSHSLAGASELADQVHVATELANPNGSDHLSDAAVGNLAMKSQERRRFWKHVKPKLIDLGKN